MQRKFGKKRVTRGRSKESRNDDKDGVGSQVRKILFDLIYFFINSTPPKTASKCLSTVFEVNDCVTLHFLYTFFSSTVSIGYPSGLLSMLPSIT